jgi:hypothetical protein
LKAVDPDELKQNAESITKSYSFDTVDASWSQNDFLSGQLNLPPPFPRYQWADRGGLQATEFPRKPALSSDTQTYPSTPAKQPNP